MKIRWMLYGMAVISLGDALAIKMGVTISMEGQLVLAIFYLSLISLLLVLERRV